ncbi:MAG: hypothetical protein WA840_08250 [Caulobacteraceae bacterium]
MHQLVLTVSAEEADGVDAIFWRFVQDLGPCCDTFLKLESTPHGDDIRWTATFGDVELRDRFERYRVV